MSDAPALGWAILASPRLSGVLSTVGIGVAATTFASSRLIGWPGLIAVLALLVVLMAGSLYARRSQVEWRGLLPISLLAFLGWCVLSLIWSGYQWSTLGGLAYLAAFTFVAIFIAMSRDTIQIVRASGDVLRVVLGVSLGLEVFSGILIDAPIKFLNIGGTIATLGPISGIESSRDQLGLVATIGAISFATELRTRSVPRLTSVLSLVAAALCIALTRSPVTIGTALVVGIAAALIYGIRRVRADRRQAWQFVVLSGAVIGLGVVWVLRDRVIALFNAGGVLDYRLDLWRQILGFISVNPLQGQGWIGAWRPTLPPFNGLITEAARPASSALNAYLDVLLQLGWIGLIVFTGMLGLAFVRSWLLAGRRRSVIYAWPAAVLVALIMTSLAESSMLVDFGWTMFAICALKASQELSWRSALRDPPVADPLTPAAERP